MPLISDKKSTYSGPLPGVDLKKRVQEWMKDRGFIPNANGTLRMVKVTNSDGSSHSQNRTTGQRAYYAPGQIVEAEDYYPNASCGRGLHFSSTQAKAEAVTNARGKSFVVDVDIESMCLIDYGADKVKARWCEVIREGNEMDFFFEPEWE